MRILTKFNNNTLEQTLIFELHLYLNIAKELSLLLRLHLCVHLWSKSDDRKSRRLKLKHQSGHINSSGNETMTENGKYQEIERRGISRLGGVSFRNPLWRRCLYLVGKPHATLKIEGTFGKCNAYCTTNLINEI